MGFEIGSRVQTTGITKEQLKSQLKEKEQSAADSIFDKFNTNKTENKDGEQVLDQTEQVSLMSWFKKIAGQEDGDTKISRRDVRRAKKEGGDENELKQMGLTFKALKHIMNNIQNALNINNTEEANDDVNIQYNNGQILAEGENGATTTYTINENDQVSNSTTTAQDGSNISSTNFNYQENTLGSTQTIAGNTTTDVDFNNKTTRTTEVDGDTTIVTDYNGTEADEANKTKQVITDGPKTITMDYQGKTKTEVNTETGITTVTEYSDNSLADGKETKVSTFNSNDKTLEVKEGDTTITYSNASGTDPQGATKESKEVINGNQKITTNYSDMTRSTFTTDGGNGSITRLERIDANENAIITTDFDEENHTASITKDGKTVELEMAGNGSIITYAKFDNNKIETGADAAKRLGFKEGTPEYKRFLEINNIKADQKLKVGQQLRISQNMTLSEDFNAEAAKVDPEQEQQELQNYNINVRSGNPSKYTKKAVDRFNEGQTDNSKKLRQTWAFAVETTDLATNGIDGDVAENLGNIVEESAIEGAEAAATTFVFMKASKAIQGLRGVRIPKSSVPAPKSPAPKPAGKLPAPKTAGELPAPASAPAKAGSGAGAQQGAKAGASQGTQQGAKTGAKQGAEQGTKAGAKQGTEQGAKTGANQGAEQGAKAGAKQGTEQGAKAGAKKGAEQDAKAGAKQGTEQGAKAGAKKGAEQGTAQAAKEAEAKRISEMGSKFVKGGVNTLSDAEKQELATLFGTTPDKLGNMTKSELKKVLLKYHPDRNSEGIVGDAYYRIASDLLDKIRKGV